ncbi:hypothetical protein [Bernardetia sp. MNP-M8]|uniref:hypothetical protein n=1 Tax=Bernardetia sp. MNP-M8 TaxID=3127470 RepID=UPI0030D3C1AF
MSFQITNKKENLISAITENLEWVLKTEQMISIKKEIKDEFGVEQYQSQKESLLTDLKEFYKELNIEVEFKMAIK